MEAKAGKGKLGSVWEDFGVPPPLPCEGLVPGTLTLGSTLTGLQETRAEAHTSCLYLKAPAGLWCGAESGVLDNWFPQVPDWT